MTAIVVMTQAELDAALKRAAADLSGYYEIDIRSEAGVWLEVGSTPRSSTVRASGSSTVSAFDSSTVSASGSSTVSAFGSSTVRASGSSTVSAFDSSTVSASDSSTVSAFDSSTVSASDSSTVSAFDSSTVSASGSSTVRASGSSTVRAFDSSTVSASDSSTVSAFDSSTVSASDSSTVSAFDSSTVSASGSSTVRASGSSTVRAFDSSTVSAFDSSKVSAFGSSTVSASGSSTVSAFGSSTVSASGSSTVRASGSSTVRAFDSSKVSASPKVAVHLHSARATVEGGVVIDVFKPITTTADWCEHHGVEITTVDGRQVATVFKAVDDAWTTPRGTDYSPGSTPSCPDWRPDDSCGGGLHFGPSPHHALAYHDDATRFLACGVALDDLIVITGIGTAKCKAPAVVVPCVEVDVVGRPVTQASEAAR